jgi:hypothetical protein
MTVVNSSSSEAVTELYYLTADATLEDVNVFYDEVLGNLFGTDSPFWPNFMQLFDIDAIDMVEPGGSLSYDVPLTVAQEIVFDCAEGEKLRGVEIEPFVIDNTNQTLSVIDLDAASSPYEASVTWDGVSCVYDGPSVAALGDRLSMTVVNSSSSEAVTEFYYLTADATLEDVNVFYDEVLGNLFGTDSPFWPNFMQFFDIDAIDMVEPGGSLSYDVPLTVAQEIVFDCAEGEKLRGVEIESFVIDNTDQTLTVIGSTG